LYYFTGHTTWRRLGSREWSKVGWLQSPPDLGVRRSSPLQRDDVFDRHTVTLQRREQSERKILVEKNNHDA
jgi:hypothetical protein